MITVKKFRHGKAERKEGRVIERGSPGDAADTVGAKKLSRHSVGSRWQLTNKKFSTEIAEGRGRNDGCANL